MKKRLMLILMACCLVGIGQADLAVTNGDFEADTEQTSNVTDWYDTVTANTANWWETTWAGPNVSPNGTPVLGLSYMSTTTNWAYQSLGTNNSNLESIVVAYDVGSFTDAGGARDLGVTISVYESDGSFVPADNTDVDGATGITPIDSVSTLHEAVAVGAVLADQTVTLDLSTAGSGEIFLRFENFAGATGEPWTAIDNVKIKSVENIQPADDPTGENPVTLSQILEWQVLLSNAEYINLYLDTESDPNLSNPVNKVYDAEPVTTTTYAPTLDYDTTYYWKVELLEPNDLAGATDMVTIGVGPVWSFVTYPETPTISAVDPAFTAVDAGTGAVLSVVGVNIDEYQWYKVGDANPLVDGTDFSGATTDTLTVNDVQLTDEGYYYCVGTNAAGSSSNEETGPCRVMVKRLTSYYPFETTTVVDSNTITPDTVGGFDAVLLQDSASAGMPVLDDANQLDASLGYYLMLDNADHATDPNGQFAQIPAGVVDYGDITISVWAYPNGDTNWGRLFDFGSEDDDYLFFAPDNGEGSSHFAITTEGVGGEQTLNASWLPWSTWSYVTVTISSDTGRLYVNGELAATNTAMTNDPVDLGAVLNFIGKSQFDVDPEFNGLIDELKIYNYARTTEQIAQDYLDIQGEWVCNYELYDLAYDFDGNCRVDLADFAIFAATWLDSYRIYPQ